MYVYISVIDQNVVAVEEHCVLFFSLGWDAGFLALKDVSCFARSTQALESHPRRFVCRPFPNGVLICSSDGD